MHGLGIYTWPSGMEYHGHYEYGLKHGHGVFTWSNGKKYDGEWYYGKQSGRGFLTTPDRVQISANWYLGEIIESSKVVKFDPKNPPKDIVHCFEEPNDKFWFN